ncbi:hypothetical protein [Microbacterium enclense]|uniref:hypothetical protein n=1 Tax=Microbacterium enclense TaxID=993073 RepID=UPI003D72AFF3
MAVPQRASAVDDFQRRREDVRARFVAKSRAVTAAAAGELDEVSLYEVIDLASEFDALLEEWCEVEDDYERQQD